MDFASLNLPTFMDTSSSNLIDDFFVPVLRLSKSYDRGVGFFSSGWFRVASKGMKAFAENGGKARWVTSPILEERDFEALLSGEEARQNELLKYRLEEAIKDLEKSLEEETLSALAWLVADEVIDFRLALPRNKLDQGNFHDKFGIFEDFEGKTICFNGSYNDSIQGLRNYESIKIFPDWEEAFVELVKAEKARFQSLWDGDDPNVRTCELTQAAKEQIVQLRSLSRPYQPQNKTNCQIRVSLPKKPRIPLEIELRDYQKEAIDAWFNAGCHGLFEMATGTGKTITALAAVTRLIEREKRLALIIVCPYRHLVEQWSDEAEKFGFNPIKIFESHKNWEPDLISQLRLFNRLKKEVVTLICSNASFNNEKFLRHVREYFSNSVLVMDEVHSAGAPKFLKALPQEIPFRLGLSATPFRHYDPEGSNKLIDYFNDIVYKLGLKEAIGPFLTPYFYYPILVPLKDEEFENFIEVTEQIRRFFPAHSEEEKGQPSEAQKRLLIKRARIMNNSKSKVAWIMQEFDPFQEISYSIFYVGEGIFEEITKTLGIEKRIKIHRFTSKESAAERQDILRRFASKDLQALVAMKCLDEGVDIPPTRNAYFLASSGNPREFVQRRGRVLRKFPGKDFASIYDLISIPPWEFLETGRFHPAFPAIKSMLKREYRRLADFAELAENKYKATEQLFNVLNKFGMLGDD